MNILDDPPVRINLNRVTRLFYDMGYECFITLQFCRWLQTQRMSLACLDGTDLAENRAQSTKFRK